MENRKEGGRERRTRHLPKGGRGDGSVDRVNCSGGGRGRYWYGVYGGVRVRFGGWR